MYFGVLDSMRNKKVGSTEGGRQSDWPRFLPGGAAEGFRILGDLLIAGSLEVEETIKGQLGDESVDASALARRSVTSIKLPKADGRTGQNTGRGKGIKTEHIQDDAISEAKLHPLLRQKIAANGSTRSQQSLSVLRFDQNDQSDATRSIKLEFEPRQMFGLSMISSNYGNRYRRHGGLICGYADFSEDSISQFSLGPVVHYRVKDNEPEFFRMSTVGPETLTGTNLPDQSGVALSLFIFGTDLEQKELYLVKATERVKETVTFRLTRAVAEPASPLETFDLECYFLFFS